MENLDINNQGIKNSKVGILNITTGEKIVFAVVIILTVACWIYMAFNSGSSGMDGMVMNMDAGLDPSMEADMQNRLASSATLVSLPPISMFVPMWVAMCIAMMLPTAIPMIHCMNRISLKRRQQGRAYAPSWFFILGYVIVWVSFGLVCWVVGYFIFSVFGTYLSDWRILWIVVGCVFAFSGIYQLSPLKYACLHGCQHPVSFLLKHWHEGKTGALRMGLLHGGNCSGCCAALMIVMFPLGMMNLVWMGLFTVLMFLEKNARFGTILSKIAGWLLLVAGVIVTVMGLIMFNA